MLHRHRIGIFLAAFVLGTIASHGQITGTKTLGEELTRLESSKHGDDIVLGDIPEYFVAPQKTKAIIKAIDLEARTIKVIPIKKNGSFRVAQINEQGRAWSTSKEMTLVFIAPKGLEQIKASGQAAKHLGKKRLRLDEIPLDARIKVEYYPAGPAAREVIVTAVPKG